MNKAIYFDMDGTLANLYGVDNWLAKLRAFDASPYEDAEVMLNMQALAHRLNKLKANGYTIGIISWLSKDSTEEYKNAVRKAKLEWLVENGFPFDKVHFVQYGATKADSVRRYLADDECAILIDDNAKVCNGWHLGETINPTECDLIEALKNLLG